MRRVQRPRDTPWLWIVLGTTVLTQSALHLVRPMISYRALSVGAGAGEVGYVGAAFALLPAVAALPLGRYAERIGSARLIGTGTAGLAAAALLLARSGSVATLALWSSVLGLAHLLFMVGAQSLTAARTRHDERDRHFGWFTAAAGVGQLIGPALGGVIAAGTAPQAGTTGTATTGALLAAAVLAALALPVLAPLLVAGREGVDRRFRAAAAQSPRTSLRIPGVGSAMLASVAVLGCLDLVTIYLPVVGTETGVGPAAVGALLSLRAATSTASRLLMPLLTNYVDRVRLLAAAIAMSAPALAVLPLGGNVPTLGILVALCGLFLGVGQPLTITWLVSLVPRATQARALTLRLGANRVGQIVIPSAAGLVAAVAGVGTVFLALGLLQAVTFSTTVLRSRAGGHTPPA